MIGGTDIILESLDVRAAMDMAIRVIRLAWDCPVFEDADTGEVFASYSNIAFAEHPEILAYRSADARAEWKEFGPDSSLNGTMIHLIARRGELTLGLDDEPTDSIRAIVDIIRGSLRSELFAGAAKKPRAVEGT